MSPKKPQVSIATASRVLNGSTRKVRNQSYVKVMEAATKLNYRPNAYAQAVAKGTAPNIVLLVSDISDPYFASVSQGVVKAAAERGISVTIGVAATPHEELEAVRKSVSTRPRGIIISESELHRRAGTPGVADGTHPVRSIRRTCRVRAQPQPALPGRGRGERCRRARHRKADRRFRVYAPCDSQGR